MYVQFEKSQPENNFSIMPWICDISSRKMNRKFYVASAGMKRFGDFYVSKNGALLAQVASKETA